MSTSEFTYSCRTDLFHKNVIWRIDGDTLIRAEDGRPEERLPLSQATGIHLAAAPTRPALNRFICTLQLGSRKVPISNTHYEGFADLKDQSASFNPFIIALHQAVARAAPSATGRIGASAIGYALAMIFGWGALLLLLGLLVMFWDRLHTSSIIKALLMLLLAGAMWTYTKSNKPRTYRPAELPLDVLPRPRD